LREPHLMSSLPEEGRVEMPETDIDSLGPVDFLIVEFPEGTRNLTGESLAELAKLVESQQVRVLDLLFLAKNDDGSVEPFEIDDLDDVDDIRFLESELAEILAEEDVVNLAAAMEPGSFAAVLVYENLWAAPFASAVRRAGGQLVANGRIPIQALIASLGLGDDATSTSEGD
jgi:hypothetical protein